MNLILIESEELVGDDLVTLGGRRGEHILKILKPEIGQSLKVGVVGGDIGVGVVESTSKGAVSLRVSLHHPPAPHPHRTLILAMQRPPTLRKILQQGTALGLDAVHLIRARRVEKSYFQSPLLEPAALGKELRLGLEQAKDTRPPAVHIHPRFRPFVEDALPGILKEGAVGFVAHPQAEGGVYRHKQDLKGGAAAVLALGPEGGWVDFEVEGLIGAGLRPISLGERILRSETATIALMAQVALLQQL